MATYKDTKGREWHLSLDPLSMEYIRDELHVDLFDPWESADIFAKFLDNWDAFGRAVWHLIESQAGSMSVDQDAWKSGLSGDVMFAAQEAFKRARADFIPNKQQRETWIKAMALGAEGMEELAEVVMEKMDTSGLVKRSIDSAISSLESAGLARPD